MISHWLGWFSLGLCMVLALKYIARKTKISSLNLVFRKLHIPFGVMLLPVGTLHGVIAFVKVTGRTVPIVTGIAAIALVFLIAATYVFRATPHKPDAAVSPGLSSVILPENAREYTQYSLRFSVNLPKKIPRRSDHAVLCGIASEKN